MSMEREEFLIPEAGNPVTAILIETDDGTLIRIPLTAPMPQVEAFPIFGMMAGMLNCDIDELDFIVPDVVVIEDGL